MDTESNPETLKSRKELIEIGLCEVLNPENIGKSECMHRAVTAAFVAKLNPDSDYTKIQAYLSQQEIDGEIKERDGNKYLVIRGFNSWEGVEDPLNCKTANGFPNEIPLEGIQYIQPDQYPNGFRIEQVDEACPKRTNGNECNIEHAEMRAMRQTLVLLNEFPDLQLLDSELFVNWVPCIDCFQKLIDMKGFPQLEESGFSIVSLFAIDQEDIDNANAIKGAFGWQFYPPHFIRLAENLKTPGYGWTISTRDFYEEIRDLLKESTIGSKDQQLVRGALLRVLNNFLET
ncbi:hypothetical protein LRY64_00175 [Candidatus Woesebacteria bacterium]|nr:hypothetical protein [Candidatus Woesebacteria bacterium]